jgi:hypothetical protein
LVRFSNLSFNHWGFDTTAAVTWLNTKIGFEVSAAPGFTFNWENPDTVYKTGTEFHVEWALLQHFSKRFAAGVAGFHYQQVTGDSGAGARLGDFKGRVTALAPVVTYSFNLGKIAVSTQWTDAHHKILASYINPRYDRHGSAADLTAAHEVGPLRAAS